MPNNINILHISSDYYFTEVYDKLFTALSNKGINQVVYTALKKEREIPKIKTELYQIVSASILSKIDSVLFNRRVNKSMNALLAKIDITQFTFIHSHFLFTDGALALKLYKKFGIPYIVTVRNTDISIYFKYFPHLRNLVRRILNSAKKVIFISPGHRKFVEEVLTRPTDAEIKQKFRTIPNGINSYWHQNVNTPKHLKSLKEVNFLFVGETSLNKNLEYTISLLEELQHSYKVKLTVVGKKSDGFEKFVQQKKDKLWVNYLGEIREIDKLKEIYQNADIFIMLSKFETFGLVYVEAMSQGTPVLYSEGQGIDGYFEEGKIGYAFPNKNGNSVAFEKNIKKIVTSYFDFSSRCIQEIPKFSWEIVAEEYMKIYTV